MADAKKEKPAPAEEPKEKKSSSKVIILVATIMVIEAGQNVARGQAIVDFLKWMLTDGQALAEPLSYAPLPKEVVAREQQLLTRIRVGA